MLHGECVSIGMMFEVEIGIALKITKPIVKTQLEECLKVILR